MPPILHPRSKSTSTLFTATLAVCFLVVGAPHLLPCPVNPRQYADTIEGPDGQPMKRRRRRKQVTEGEEVETVSATQLASEQVMAESKKRECPVPKPGGLVGQIMGFKEQDRERPSQILVKEWQGRKAGSARHETGGNEP